MNGLLKEWKTLQVEWARRTDPTPARVKEELLSQGWKFEKAPESRLYYSDTPVTPEGKAVKTAEEFKAFNTALRQAAKRVYGLS